MDGESSLSEESIKQKKLHQIRNRINSDESNPNDSDPGACSPRMDFDALKIDTPSKGIADDISDPLLLPSNNNENEAHTTANDDEPVQKVLERQFQIKLVPLESLLKKKDTPIELSSVTSTETSDDEPLSCIISKTKTKKKFTKHRSTQRTNQIEISDLDESDSDVIVPKRRHKTKDKTTDKLPDNIFSAKIQLSKLPSNMEPLLMEYNLSAICDAANVIVSRKCIQRNEVDMLFAKRLNRSLFHCNSEMPLSANKAHTHTNS